MSAGILGGSVLDYTPYFHLLIKVVNTVGDALHWDRRWGSSEKREGFDDERLQMGRL